jgi:hypothetical protein
VRRMVVQPISLVGAAHGLRPFGHQACVVHLGAAEASVRRWEARAPRGPARPRRLRRPKHANRGADVGFHLPCACSSTQNLSFSNKTKVVEKL